MKTSQRVHIIQNTTIVGLMLGMLTIVMLSPRNGTLHLLIGLWSVPLGVFLGWASGFLYAMWLGRGLKNRKRR